MVLYKNLKSDKMTNVFYKLILLETSVVLKCIDRNH